FSFLLSTIGLSSPTKSMSSAENAWLAHEQNNTSIKGDGGAVGLTNNPSALRRWMVLGPKVARVIEEFKDEHQYWSRQRDTHHHDQIPSVQTSFIKDVHSLVSVTEELGNPLEEESLDLVALYTKEIASPSAAETVRNAKSIGQDQFQTFTRECLMEGTKPTEAPPATSVVLDGAAVLQMLKAAAAKNFEEYAQEVFIPYMSTKIQTASQLDLLFDRYVADLLKCTARANRRQGVLKRVNFLRVDSNKTELFKFLSDALLTWFDKEDKQLVITDGQTVLSKPVFPELASIAHAITKMQTVACCSQHGQHKILIRTVDTDFVVLAVSVVQGMHQDELWLAFDTGKSFRYLGAHEMTACLGPEKARALPAFHALTGCDTVSSVSGY
ncbi:hypothetical protein Hamer_G003415, partial [Homarus americanus]